MYFLKTSNRERELNFFIGLTQPSGMRGKCLSKSYDML